MINVYINSMDNNSCADILYQSPSGNNKVLNCNFYFNDEEILDKRIVIDFLVVFNRAKPSRLLKNINLNNTLIIAIEPPSVHKYKHKYLKQFKYVFNRNPDYKEDNKQEEIHILPWSVGINRTKIDKVDYKNKKEMNFETLKNYQFNKKKLISVAETNKRLCKEHIVRAQIISALKEKFPEAIDSFGWNGNHVPDKFDMLKDYYYHICISNYWGESHVDEKIYDPLIAKCNPIYLGASNIKDHFGTNFYPIKPDDMNYNIEMIKKILERKKHEFEFEEQRNMIFTKYNYFTFLAKFIEKHVSSNKRIGTIEVEDYIFIIKHKIQSFLSNNFYSNN
jgi:hypothetical protein